MAVVRNPPAPPKEPSRTREKSLVLVIDDDPAVRELLTRTLEGDGYRVESAMNGEEGIAMATRLRPAAITLDVLMPREDGWAVLQSLKREPATAAIPVIMVSMVDDRSKGLALGAAEYLVKPVEREQLSAVLAKLGPERPCEVLVVEDEAASRQMLERLLEQQGYSVASAENGRIALERLAKAKPRLVLLDLMMPEMDGFELLAQMRADPELRRVPVVVITAKDLGPDDRRRLNGQAEKLLQKGRLDREALMRDVRELVGDCVREKAA